MRVRRGIQEIKEGNVNVTPLIDIVMCLIIFFMLVAKIGVTTGADSTIVPPETILGDKIEDIGNSLTLNVRGGPLLLGSSELAGQVGGGLALRFMTRLSPSLALEALGIVPAHVEQAGLEARVGLVSLRVLPGLELVERPRGTLGMMLAPGVDLISFRSARAPREVAPQPKSSRVQPVAGLRLRGSLRVSSFMALLLGAGLDVDFTPRRWVLTGPAGSQEVFETSRYRPYAFLGADLTLFRGRRSKP